MLFYFDNLIYNNIGDNMTNLKKIVIILLVLIGCFIFFYIFNKKEKNKETIVDCDVFQNNPYKIIFHSNGGPEVETVEICEDCPRDENNLLPVLTRKGYNFEGWFYDEYYLMKVNVRTIDELEISIARDDDGCDYKYKDIDLYALWTKK